MAGVTDIHSGPIAGHRFTGARVVPAGPTGGSCAAPAFTPAEYA